LLFEADHSFTKYTAGMLLHVCLLSFFHVFLKPFNQQRLERIDKNGMQTLNKSNKF